MEIGAKFVSHDPKAARDRLNGRCFGIFVLTEAGRACVAADRAPESLVPLVLHRTGNVRRLKFVPGTSKFNLGHSLALPAQGFWLARLLVGIGIGA